MIRALIRRGAVIGMAMDAWMIVPGWEEADLLRRRWDVHWSGPLITSIISVSWPEILIMLALELDLDGGFGREQCPADLDSIADLVCIPELLSRRNYSSAAIGQIMHGNWLRLLLQGLKIKGPPKRSLVFAANSRMLFLFFRSSSHRRANSRAGPVTSFPAR